MGKTRQHKQAGKSIATQRRLCSLASEVHKIVQRAQADEKQKCIDKWGKEGPAAFKKP